MLSIIIIFFISHIINFDNIFWNPIARMSEIQNILDEMKSIQEKLLEYIENESSAEDSFTNLTNIFTNLNIHENSYKLRSLLHMLLAIAENHHSDPSFYKKIERILSLFKSSIKKFYSNSEIINIFKNDKRILLFSIKEGIINVDNYFIKTITTVKYKTEKYPNYFQPELKPLFNDEILSKIGDNKYRKELVEQIQKDLPDNFERDRLKGENPDPVCLMIQNDIADDFIAYLNQTNLPINSYITHSIFEKNSFLNKRKNITMIEYAAFFGSMAIMKYFQFKNADLLPSLWIYAVHSNNPAMIHFLEENNVKPEMECLIEAIKCHHNNIANYLLENFFENEKSSPIIFISALKSYNLYFIEKWRIETELFYYLCKYDYCLFVDLLLKNQSIDVNQKKI